MREYKIVIFNLSSFGKIFPEHIDLLKKIGPVDYFQVDNEINGKEFAKLLNGYNIIASVIPFLLRSFLIIKMSFC